MPAFGIRYACEKTYAFTGFFSVKRTCARTPTLPDPGNLVVEPLTQPKLLSSNSIPLTAPNLRALSCKPDQSACELFSHSISSL